MPKKHQPGCPCCDDSCDGCCFSSFPAIIPDEVEFEIPEGFFLNQVDNDARCQGWEDDDYNGAFILPFVEMLNSCKANYELEIYVSCNDCTVTWGCTIESVGCPPGATYEITVTLGVCRGWISGATFTRTRTLTLDAPDENECDLPVSFEVPAIDSGELTNSHIDWQCPTTPTHLDECVWNPNKMVAFTVNFL